jgi:hypothetical protein
MGSGGARSGAGRKGRKVKADGLLFIDVRRFARLGYLDTDGAYSWVWRRLGEVSGSIHVYVQAGSHLRLVYTSTVNGKSKDYNDRVELAYSACNFGSLRPWFVCPRCHKRLAKLYLRFGYFACRHCQNVAYSSQSQDAIDRTWGVQYKIEARIGENHKRPKGMHHKTFERLRDSLYHAIQFREAAIDARMAQFEVMLAGIEVRMKKQG